MTEFVNFASFMAILGVVVGVSGCFLMIYNLHKASQERLDNRAVFLSLIPISILLFLGTATLTGSVIFDRRGVDFANQRRVVDSLFIVLICSLGITASGVVVFLYSVWQRRLVIQLKSKRQNPLP